MSADTSGGSQSFFHATTGRAAEEILASGFRDAEGFLRISHAAARCLPLGLPHR